LAGIDPQRYVRDGVDVFLSAYRARSADG